MNKPGRSTVERERVLFEYGLAMEQGDFDRVEAILNLAGEDASLEKMIVELNEAYCASEFQRSQLADAQLINLLLREHLPSGVYEDEEYVQPLTVGDVIAKMVSDAALRGVKQHERTVLPKQLRNNGTVLPKQLGMPNVRELFQQLSLTVSHQFQKIFRDAAILLSMGREQHLAQLAATRKQREQRKLDAASQPEANDNETEGGKSNDKSTQ